MGKAIRGWFVLRRRNGQDARRGVLWKAKLLLIPLAVAAVLLTGGLLRADGVPVTRPDAIETILDIIVPANLDHNVTAFLGMLPLQAGDVIRSSDAPERQRTMTADTWFCWIDDNPQAFFEHNTTYVIIDVATGGVDVIVEGWWPELNGSPLFMTDAEWEDPDIVIYSCIHTTTVGGP